MTTNSTPPIWFIHFHRLFLENMANPDFTNAHLAGQLQISDRKLYRKIKQLTGLSPNLYFRKVRLHKAHELLQTGNYITVKEVVAQVGFIKVTYFYQLFKEQYGYSPGVILQSGLQPGC